MTGKGFFGFKGSRIVNRSTRSRRFGFPETWDVTIVDGKGRVAFDTIPLEHYHVLAKGDDFVSEKGYETSDVEAAGGLDRFLRRNFAVAQLDGYWFVGEEMSHVSLALMEWKGHGANLPPEVMCGYRVTPGSRDAIAIATMEPGFVRPDMAAYVEAYSAFANRCDPSREFLYDGWYQGILDAGRLDPEFMRRFAEALLPEEPDNAYDREIMRITKTSPGIL